MSARNRELFGLLPATLLVTGGFTAVLLTRVSNVHDATLTYGAVFLGCCLLAHLFIRWRLPNADPYLFPIAAVLASIGLVELYRIQESFAIKQAGWFALGLVFFCATIVLLRDYRVLERYRYTIAAASIGLLLLPRVVGQATNGAYLAIHIGSFSFQPAEFAKIGVIIFLASYLRDVREVLVQGRLPRVSLKHMGPLLVVWGAAMLMLIFIRDLGSSLMFFGGFLALLYVATGRLSLVGAGATLFGLGAWFFSNHIAHVHSRVEIWLHPFQPDLVEGKGYQIAQGLFAQADGGLMGKGFSQSLLYLPGGHSILPAPHTDLIYAVITNELGLFGAAGLLMAYLLFIRRGFKTAMISGDGFGKLLAAGLTAVFALQVFVIVGGVTKVIPLTGVTLPFISYGGSSIIANFVLLALLLVVSDSARSRQELTGGVVT
ncbi:MAG: FtsW/RodA/SpoVE family cell cycle protein [Thermoleophilaceae bacterium]|jgi:cell division protein FtsW (lipid II flippase)